MKRIASPFATFSPPKIPFSSAVVAEDRAVDESEDENEDEESFLMSQPVWQDHLSGRSEELFCGYACMLFNIIK